MVNYFIELIKQYNVSSRRFNIETDNNIHLECSSLFNAMHLCITYLNTVTNDSDSSNCLFMYVDLDNGLDIDKYY